MRRADPFVRRAEVLRFVFVFVFDEEVHVGLKEVAVLSGLFNDSPPPPSTSLVLRLLVLGDSVPAGGGLGMLAIARALGRFPRHVDRSNSRRAGPRNQPRHS